MVVWAEGLPLGVGPGNDRSDEEASSADDASEDFVFGKSPEATIVVQQGDRQDDESDDGRDAGENRLGGRPAPRALRRDVARVEHGGAVVLGARVHSRLLVADPLRDRVVPDVNIVIIP